MDKNTITGFLLIAALILLFGYINDPQKNSDTEKETPQIETTKIEKREERKATFQTTTTQSDKKDNIKEEVQTIEENLFTLENENLIIKFSNKGGSIKYVELKKYKTFDGKPLILCNSETVNQFLQFNIKDTPIETSDLNFVIDNNTSGNQVILKSKIGEGYIEFVYTLGDEFKLDFDINFINLKNEISHSTSYMAYIWDQKLAGTEKGRKWENTSTTLNYKYYKDEVDYLSAAGEKTEELKTRVKWIAYKQQFFSSILVAKESFLSAEVHSKDLSEQGDQYLKEFSSNILLPFNNNTSTINLSFYFIPNKHEILAKQGEKFEELLDLGWGIISWINEYVVILLFNFLEKYISNYGIIILLLTLIIKMVLFPLTYKSYISQAKMKVLKPQIDKINERIPSDKQVERQQETMKLYRKVGVSPMGGCLPMMIQMPILFAMFRFFPSAMELRGESFLWATDLSSYDSIFTLPFTIPVYGNHVSLFTLLMTVTNIFYTKINSQNMNMGGQMAGMKYMMYLMPVFFMVWLNNYSAGLSYYYFISLLITIIQTLAIKASFDDTKILAKLEANKKVPKKKSRFQIAMDQAQKKQKGRK